MKTIKILGKSEKTSNSYSRDGSLLNCKKQFSCNFQGFNFLEICNKDVCLSHLSKYIFATNNSTVHRTATEKEIQKTEILGIFFNIVDLSNPCKSYNSVFRLKATDLRWVS